MGALGVLVRLVLLAAILLFSYALTATILSYGESAPRLLGIPPNLSARESTP